jgi:TATA-box binding protein (TBP) (component of TFIID and TFIIIB)
MKKTILTLFTAGLMIFTGCASTQESMSQEMREQMEEGVSYDKKHMTEEEQHAERGDKYDAKEMNKLNN